MTGYIGLKEEAMKYVYSFVVWPDETWDFDRAVFDLFNVLTGRVEMQFTAEDFERFRSRLSHHGFTLREVTRRPHVQPEPVY
jgi:hypothetical protein